jgi:hypothetical protein
MIIELILELDRAYEWFPVLANGASCEAQEKIAKMSIPGVTVMAHTDHYDKTLVFIPAADIITYLCLAPVGLTAENPRLALLRGVLGVAYDVH